MANHNQYVLELVKCGTDSALFIEVNRNLIVVFDGHLRARWKAHRAYADDFDDHGDKS